MRVLTHALVGHDSHWEPDAQDWLREQDIYTFFLHSQFSQQDQPNDNGPNAALAACYREAYSE
eukprot:2523544-Rhodomonas_salina.1